MDSQFFPAFLILLFALGPLSYMRLHTACADKTDGRLAYAMKRLFIVLAAYTCMTLSGFSLLAYMQMQNLALQISSDLILLVIAIGMFMGIKLKSEETEQGLSISVCLLVAASLSSLMLYQTSRNGCLKEVILAIICAYFIQILMVGTSCQRPRQKNYSILIMSLQKLVALILIMLAVQDLLSGMHAQFSTITVHTGNIDYRQPGLHQP